ncbi:hypothetical protein DERP_012573 [Dermatophagoides pteronyssinus]|uniref:Uncharacterized protein n=1 Tax=Dermatophagoides pteronyssinus TaxID=6956 RepID=A0ABQ8IUV5_DERPT|nr:hypothetical protein DERP_012573 [Dermatophagoides pteronyssinus]
MLQAPLRRGLVSIADFIACRRHSGGPGLPGLGSVDVFPFVLNSTIILFTVDNGISKLVAISLCD